MSTFGNRFKISVFGESHGECIGVVIEGLPAGFAPDFDAVRRELARRAPGIGLGSTPRKEADEFEIMSGIFNGRTTGAPLMAHCRNEDTRSRDYTPHLPRPGHADLAAQLKYRGFNDYRGGGHFSGRLTAPIVFAGAIARQLLFERYRLQISAKIASICGETDADRFPELIADAQAHGNSVGGVIECIATDVPVGWGEPIFASVESNVAAMMFSIPAVKGIEFGDGFSLSEKFGSEVSDGYGLDPNGNVVLTANHNGGINGGITNGAALRFCVAIKPTPTISAPQKTVDLQTNQAVTHSFAGRHDACIVPRAVPVIEAGLAICLMEYF